MAVYTQPGTTLHSSDSHLMGKVDNGVQKTAKTPPSLGFASKIHNKNQEETNTVHPLFVERARQSTSVIPRPSWIKFETSSLFQTYTQLRLYQYLFQAMFPVFSEQSEKFLFSKLGLDNHKLPKWLQGSSSNIPSGKRGGRQKSSLQDDLDYQYGGVQGGGAKVTESKDPSTGRAITLAAEGMTFTGLAIISTKAELDNVMKNCRLALSAELGKPEHEISYTDLFASANPLISSEVNRLIFKAVSRLGAGAGFMKGLTSGLVANAIVVTMERSVFYQKNAYDLLVEIVNEAQSNHYTGAVSREIVVNGLQKVLQSSQHDHNRAHITEKEMHELRPVLEQVAEDLLNKKIGIESLIGIMGGGIIIVGQPEQSEDNYAYIREHKLEGIAELAQRLRRENGSQRDGTVWETQKETAEVQPRQKGIATSASPNRLMQDRIDISSNQVAHLGVR